MSLDGHHKPYEVRIGITAIPAREEDAVDVVIEACDGADALETPQPVEIFMHEGEIGHQGLISNQRRMWEGTSIRGDSRWCLLLADDVILADRFQAKIVERLREAREDLDAQVVSLFCRRKAADIDLTNRWIKQKPREFGWEPALAMRSEVARAFADFGWSVGHEYKHSDNLLRDFFVKEKLPIWYTIPSLADHRIDIKSSIGTGPAVFGRPRNSELFDKEGA